MIKIRPQFKGNAFNDRFMTIVREELGRAMQESVILLETTVALMTPVNFGILRAGIHGRVINHLHGDVTAVGPGANYVEFIELGRRPGKFPPVDAIRLWVKRKLKVTGKDINRVAYLVGRKIATKGFVGSFMFQKTVKKERGNVIRIFQLAANRISSRT